MFCVSNLSRGQRPGADEVVVEMQAAPINPADLNAIEGKYPGKREVPAVPGFEGSGIVSELGENVSKLTIGSLVILPHDLGTWREACAVKASNWWLFRRKSIPSRRQC